VKRTTAVYCRASGNSAVAGIPIAVAVHDVPIVFAAAVDPAVTEVLQSLLLLVFLLRLTSLLFQEFMPL
jgi:hypothetical protein